MLILGFNGYKLTFAFVDVTGDLRVMVESSPFYCCIERVEKTRSREKSGLKTL